MHFYKIGTLDKFFTHAFCAGEDAFVGNSATSFGNRIACSDGVATAGPIKVVASSGGYIGSSNE